MSAISLLASAGRTFSRWRCRERAYAELMALDDHSLADIGLHRSQIIALREAVDWAEPPPPAIPFSKRGRLTHRRPA